LHRPAALTRSPEVDDGALRAELGWRPVFTFEQGLAETVRWYRHT
jgi:nucleoside-diphosphate-sugar epimerase